LFSEGHVQAAVAVDLIIGLSVVLYMFYCAIGVLVKNFRSLIDLPLPEADQHKILKALVVDFDAYEGIGNFYTQLSGSTRFVQIELHFKETTTVEEIESLRMRLEDRLKEYFRKLVFHLIPLAQHKPDNDK
jgi:divalent metal cation (Fe/Co/Zn/Cd) transporter